MSICLLFDADFVNSEDLLRHENVKMKLNQFQPFDDD
jgi:hypothetical protein